MTIYGADTKNQIKGVITMLNSCTKKSRTAMRDSKYLLEIYILILPPKEGAVNGL